MYRIKLDSNNYLSFPTADGDSVQWMNFNAVLPMSAKYGGCGEEVGTKITSSEWDSIAIGCDFDTYSTRKTKVLNGNGYCEVFTETLKINSKLSIMRIADKECYIIGSDKLPVWVTVTEMSASIKVDDETTLTILYLIDNDGMEDEDMGNWDYSNYTFEVL